MVLTRCNVIVIGNNIKWSCLGSRKHRSLRCNAHRPGCVCPETGNQCSVRETRLTFPRVLTEIFAATISRAESVPASEYLRPKTKNRALGDLADLVTFGVRTRGFRTEAAAEVLPRLGPSPCLAVASRRPKTTTDAQPEREAPSRCQKKKRYISAGSPLPWRVTNTYGIITFPKRSRTMSCTTTGGANGRRDKLADPNSAVL